MNVTDLPQRISLTEWQRADPETCATLAGLALTPEPAVQTAARQLDADGMLHITELRRGLQVEATSFVGRVQLGEITITVRPKIPGETLLRLLRYAYGLRDLRLLTAAPFAATPDTLQDLLIAQLAAETREIMARGLHRRYCRQEADLASPRGRINIPAIPRRGVFPTATLPCVIHERDADNHLNQTLLAGLRLAIGLTADHNLATDLWHSATLLAERVTPIRLNRAALLAAHREENRLTAAYRPALTIIALLLAGAGVSLEEPRERLPLPGFLFDMNRFFQALLSRFLAEYLSGYLLEDQHRLHGMFHYDSAHNPKKRHAPTPRPDFVLWQGRKQEVVAVLDAKYRDLWNTALPAGMLYQLAIYALSQLADGVATILYPTLDAAAREASITIRRPTDGAEQGRVGLRPVRLDRLDDLLASDVPPSAGRLRARRAFADALAFGQDLGAASLSGAPGRS